jgi:hypothetical protein
MIIQKFWEDQTMNSKKSESKSLDLNDVLSYVRKASRREKRAIDLALRKNKEFAVEITYKSGERFPTDLVAEEDFFLELHAEYLKTGKVPGNIKIERSVSYAN